MKISYIGRVVAVVIVCLYLRVIISSILRSPIFLSTPVSVLMLEPRITISTLIMGHSSASLTL